MTFNVPFTYPVDCDVTKIIKLIETHNVEIDAQTSWCPWPGDMILSGTKEDLINLFIELDGPATSFNEEEFMEFVEDYN